MSDQDREPSSVSYDEIYEAVMETPRGRWFLKEFAERNQVSDTEHLLLAIERLRKAVNSVNPVDQVSIFRRELSELANTIQETRKEIASIKPRNSGNSRKLASSEDFDAIITSTERATSDILASTEKLQEISDRLRSRDWDKALSEELEDISTSIFMACSFHDITGQRTTKVVNTLRYLEQRVNAMLEVWCDGQTERMHQDDVGGAASPGDPSADDDAIASATSSNQPDIWGKLAAEAQKKTPTQNKVKPSAREQEAE